MARESRQVAVAGLATVGILIGLSWWFAQVDGLSGTVLALSLSAISFGSLNVLVNSLAPTERRLPKASNLTAVVVLAKLPLVALILFLLTLLSMRGVYCFLATLGLVYSAIVWHLATRAA